MEWPQIWHSVANAEIPRHRASCRHGDTTAGASRLGMTETTSMFLPATGDYVDYLGGIR